MIDPHDIIGKHQDKKGAAMLQNYIDSSKEREFYAQNNAIKNDALSKVLAKNNLYHTESAYSRALSKNLSSKKQGAQQTP
jgi:hypothetical protein